MPKARMAPLDHRGKWFLGEVAGMLRPGKDRSLDDLNWAGLRFGMECLRVLGQLPPHVGELPDVADGPARGTLERGDQVRLGDAEQVLLKSLRPCWVDGDGLSLANLNIRMLRLGEDFLRYLGFIGDYHGESIFAHLVPQKGPVSGSTVPVQPAETVAVETEQGSDGGFNKTDKGSKNGSDETAETSDIGLKNPAEGSEEETSETCETSVEAFAWDSEADGRPSEQGMQYRGTCAGCEKEYPDGATEAIWFPTSKRWLVLNCCGVGEAFLEEQAKAGARGNGRLKG